MSGATIGTTATASGTTSLAPAWSGDQPRTAGHTLFAVVMNQNAGGVVPTCTTPAGWTLDSNSNYAPGTGAEGACWIFRKTAAGSDAAPSFTLNSATGQAGLVFLIEVSGLDTSTPVDTVFTPGSGATSGVALACGAHALSTATAWVLSVAGGRGAPTSSWTSPLSALTNGTSGSGWMAAATAQLASSSSITPTDTPTGTVNASSILAVAYRTAGGGGGGTSRKVRVAGAATAVSARKARVAGSAVTATRRVRVGGVAT